MQVLPKKDFVELANHIICGDQVIIRGSDMVTVTSLLMVLKVLNMEMLLFIGASMSLSMVTLNSKDRCKTWPPNLCASETHITVMRIPTEIIYTVIPYLC